MGVGVRQQSGPVTPTAPYRRPRALGRRLRSHLGPRRDRASHRTHWVRTGLLRAVRRATPVMTPGRLDAHEQSRVGPRSQRVPDDACQVLAGPTSRSAGAGASLEAGVAKVCGHDGATEAGEPGAATVPAGGASPGGGTNGAPAVGNVGSGPTAPIRRPAAAGDRALRVLGAVEVQRRPAVGASALAADPRGIGRGAGWSPRGGRGSSQRP